MKTPSQACEQHNPWPGAAGSNLVVIHAGFPFESKLMLRTCCHCPRIHMYASTTVDANLHFVKP